MRPLSAWTITLLYAAAGALWIFAGSTLADEWLGGDHAGHRSFELTKGLVYVGVTALALYALLNREFARRDSAERARRRALEDVRTALGQSVEALGHAIEMRDPYTAGHQRRVADLAVAIARRLGLPEARVECVRLGALMHDIGKIAIPTELLTKPGALEPQEFAVIKLHPQYGYDILRHVAFDEAIHRIVLDHHERLDGSGYPHGLTGDAIGPEARIVAVADVVEAMTAHRPYRPALPLAVARSELTEKRGTRYDADAVDACLAVLDDGQWP